MPRRYLTPDQAAALLGWEGDSRGRRLTRVLRAKEKRTRCVIMVQLGGAGRGSRYGITEAMLRRHCPELFLATPDELVLEVKGQLRAIDQSVADKVLELVAPELKLLRRRIAKLESRSRP